MPPRMVDVACLGHTRAVSFTWRGTAEGGRLVSKCDSCGREYVVPHPQAVEWVRAVLASPDRDLFLIGTMEAYLDKHDPARRVTS